MAKTDFSEVDAMRSVDDALGKVEPDARQRVLDWASSKYQLKAESKSEQGRGTGAGGQSATAATVAQKDIKTFVAQKKPASFYERVACLAYYLEKVEARSEIKTGDITKANADARLSKMTNPALFVKHATHTYGYLTSLGKRQFALSSRGEAVVDALPDRAKVEAAHTEYPMSRKGKKKARNKK